MHLFGRIGLWSILLSFLCFGAMLYFKYVFPWPMGLDLPPKSFVETPLPLLTVMFFLAGVRAS